MLSHVTTVMPKVQDSPIPPPTPNDNINNNNNNKPLMPSPYPILASESLAITDLFLIL